MTIGNAPDGTIRAALRYPAFRRLLAGLAISQIGDWLYNLALVALVYGRTHSALWAGITTAARVVPIVALSPLGGVIADRFDRRRVMVTCDLIRLALMGLLALVALTWPPIAVFPLIAALATAAGAPFLPSASAVTPRLVPDADLPGANAARSAVTGLGIIVGPALGGVLLLLGTPVLAFVLNASTFGVSALAVLAIPANSAFHHGAFRTERSGERPAGLLRDIAAGAAALRAHPEAVRLVGADIVCSLVYGMQTVLLILVAHRAGLGLHGYGYLFAGIGAGGLLGTTLASRAARCPHPRAVLLAALAAVGLPMVLLAVVHWPAAAIAAAAVTGVGAILVEILTETSLQRSLPPAVFGRAYGVALPASIAGIALGSLAAPVLISLLGGSGALIACGAAATGYGILLAVPGRRPSAAPAPAENVLARADA
jgi:MFS family permease